MRYPNIQTLVLDNNCLTNIQDFPKLKKLECIWLNNNFLTQLEPILRVLKEQAPNLKHISLLGNLCCARYLFHEKQHAYGNYRRLIAKYFPKLESIDFEDIQTKEREQRFPKSSIVIE